MKLSKGTIRAMAATAATETSRYSMRGVHLKRDGDTLTAEATDGRRLLRATWTDASNNPPAFDVIVPTKGIADIGKALPKGLTACIDEASANGTVTATLPDGSTRTAITVEGAFPNLDQVIPTDDSASVVVGYDPKLLGEALLALDKLAPGVTAKLTIPTGSGPLKAEVTTDDGIHAVIVVMPKSLRE